MSDVNILLIGGPTSAPRLSQGRTQLLFNRRVVIGTPTQAQKPAYFSYPLVSWAGCGAQEPEMGSEGTYGGPCHSDGSCDEGLKCVYHVCKEG